MRTRVSVEPQVLLVLFGLVALLLLGALMIYVVSTSVGPRTDGAVIERCLLDTTAAPVVGARVRNGYAGQIAPIVVALTIRIDDRVAATREQFLFTGASSDFVIPVELPTRRPLRDLKLRCELTWTPFDPSEPVVEENYPFAAFPPTRRVVFLSGVRTTGESAVTTFETIVQELSRRLDIPVDRAHFMHFSYTGKYSPELEPSGVQRETLIANYKPAFAASDVCRGVKSATEALRELLLKFPRDLEFDLIGHSFGGVVAAHFLATLDDPVLRGQIHSVITIDSPIRGFWQPGNSALLRKLSTDFTSTAIGCIEADPTAADDVLRGSDVITRIGSMQVTPDLPNFVAIGNERDLAVGFSISHVAASEPIPWSVYCFDKDPISHGCLLSEDYVLNRIAEVIQRPWRQARIADDHGNSPLSPRNVRLSESPHVSAGSIQGRIDTPVDVDYFRIPATPDKEYEIILDDGGDDQMTVMLLDALGAVVDATPGARAFRFRPPDRLPHFVVVKSPTGRSDAPVYTIQISGRPPTADNVTLRIRSAGGGSGELEVQPLGAACPPACTHTVARGTVVTLVGRPAPGSALSAWLRPTCADPCEIRLDSDVDVSVAFSVVKPPELSAVCVGLQVLELRWPLLDGASRVEVYRDGAVVGESKGLSLPTGASAPASFTAAAWFGTVRSAPSEPVTTRACLRDERPRTTTPPGT